MFKKIVSVLLSMTMVAFSFASIVSVTSAQNKEIDYSLWDRFIKYDLRITDYDSLTDEEKELCKFIFETERSAEDAIVCARARQILAGYDVGDRVTLKLAEHYYDIMDSSVLDNGSCCLYDDKNDKMYANPIYDNVILRKVPDIKHLDCQINCNEYWLDDDGTEKILTNGDNFSFACYNYEEYYLYEKYDEDGKLIETQNIPKINEELETIEKDGCIYKIYPDNTLALSEVKDKNAASVIVPESIDGMHITGIKPNAFSESEVSEVVLPETLKYIDAFAFNECKNLNKINFPKSLESIGGCAFYNCDSLGDILIDCPNLQIPSAPFENACAKSVTINTKVISNWFMTSFKEFETFTFGNDIQEIGLDYLIGDFKIPENVKIVSGESGQLLIDSITIPANIEIFGAYKQASGTFCDTAFEHPAKVPLVENNCVVQSNCIVSGWYGTEAHSYALAYNLKFNPLDEISYGDMNNDDEINIADAVILKKYLTGNGNVGYEADLNKDGKINVFDMVTMKRILIINYN